MSSPMSRALPLILIAMACIPAGDTAGKLLTGEGGVSPFHVAWSRFALGAICLAPFVLSRSALLLLLDWRVWLRGALVTGGICSILTALQTEPIANVFGAFFVGPILSYFLAIVWLKEPVTRTRTALLLLGFVGVLLVVKPGFGMTPGLGYAVLAGCFYGAFLTASRWLAEIGRPRALMLSQLLIGSILLAPFGLSNWPSMTLPVIGLSFASAIGSLLGNLLLIFALRAAPASRIAPFVYTQLIWATVFGYVFFGTLPDWIAAAGLGLILASGLLSLRLREPA